MTDWLGLGMLRRVSGLRSVAAACLVLSLGALSSACSSGTETGNPSITGSLSYTGYSSAPRDYGLGEPGRIANLQNAWFSLSDVQVSAAGSCGLDVERSFAAPALGVGDHAAGRHNKTAYQAPAGSFCSVRLPFLAVSGSLAAGLPPALAGHAILLTGELADGTAFSIVSDATPLVELRAAESGFSLDADDANVLLAFDFATWLAPIDFAAAELANDGSIEISSRSNAELLAAFDAELTRGVALYRDRDADGALDDEAEILAAAP